MPWNRNADGINRPRSLYLYSDVLLRAAPEGAEDAAGCMFKMT